MSSPSCPQPLLVFAQRRDARIDIDAWNAHAVRFFATRIGLTAEPPHTAESPEPTTGEATFVVAPDAEPAGLRTARARPSSPADQAQADAADSPGTGGTGLARLAARCPLVWIVSRESEDDRLALRLCAILASVLLGPIFDPARGEIYGVKTARSKLEKSAVPPAGQMMS